MFSLHREATPKIRGVLFDMDGVVIDSERLYTRFWMEAAQKLGFPMTREQALQLRSLGKKPSQEKLDSFFGPGAADYDMVRNKRIELMEAHIERYGIDEKPGIRELLAYLGYRKIPCAITSSSSVPMIRRHLGNLGLLEEFTALCSGKDVLHGKPAPDIYLHGAAVLGLKPEACLAVEDSPAGIEAAYRAGTFPVMVPDQDQPSSETLAMCFATADSLADIIGLLESLK